MTPANSNDRRWVQQVDCSTIPRQRADAAWVQFEGSPPPIAPWWIKVTEFFGLAILLGAIVVVTCWV